MTKRTVCARGPFSQPSGAVPIATRSQRSLTAIAQNMRSVGGRCPLPGLGHLGAVNALASGAGTPWFALARPSGFPKAFAPFVIIPVISDTCVQSAQHSVLHRTLVSLLLMEVGTAPVVDRLTGGHSLWVQTYENPPPGRVVVNTSRVHQQCPSGLYRVPTTGALPKPIILHTLTKPQPMRRQAPQRYAAHCPTVPTRQ